MLIFTYARKKNNKINSSIFEGSTINTPSLLCIEDFIDALEWAIEGEKNGAGEILLTSMNADGTKLGYDIELTRKISTEVSIPVIASGGAGKPIDMVNVLNKGGASAVLAASIFHFGIYSIENVKKEMLRYKIPVRKTW